MGDGEPDPLDVYMSSINEEVAKYSTTSSSSKHNQAATKQEGTLESESEPEVETASRKPETNYETVEDLLAYAERQAKKKDLLPVDHTTIQYAPFRKDFYVEAPEIRRLSDVEVKLRRAELDNIRVRGKACPKPIRKWSQCGLSVKVLDVVKGLGYERPTPIQAQAIPAIMSGRDMIGVAKTGSGKTIAFLLPVLRHVADQPPIQSGADGPVALIMTPTRELAMQIYFECRKFMPAMRSRCVCVYGGAPLKEQIADMKRGAEIMICTPGRLIDLLLANSGKVTNLRRVTMLVLDEADRMFDMGFGPQVMKIMDNIRADRQTVLFSATFPPSMEALARRALHHRPLEIIVGTRSAVCEDVHQEVLVLERDARFLRLLELLGQWYPAKTSRVLVFVERQDAADELLRELLRKGYPCLSLHGGKDQADRDTAIADFKAGVVPVLVATSVAARGLDVKSLGLVVNYECPNHMEDYVHRVGRTGRAGQKGTAITFITPEQDRHAPDIVRALLASRAPVPEALQRLCDDFLERVRKGLAVASGSGFGGKGLDHFQEGRVQRKRTQAIDDDDMEERPEEREAVERQAGERQAMERQAKLPPTAQPAAAPPSQAPSTSGRAALRAAQHTAAQITSKVVASVGALPEQRTGPHATRLFGAKLFEALKRGDIVPIYDTTQPVPQGGEAIPKAYACEIIVNDFSNFVRITITGKETTQGIAELTGVTINVRGSYIAPGRPATDRPMFLRVEAESQQNVEAAKQEIMRTLRDLVAVDGKTAGTGIEMSL